MKNRPNLSETMIKSTEAVFIILVLVATTQLPLANAPARADEYSICAITVPSGTVILDQYTYRTPNGTTFTYARGTCPGHRVNLAPSLHGWVESADGSTGTTFAYLNSSWTVPSAPLNTSSAKADFFFNGLAACSSNCTLLQPVLGWGCARDSSLNCQVGGAYWWISAILWFPGNPSTFYNSIEVGINAGDTIMGNTTRRTDFTACSGSSNTGYEIKIRDSTLGYTTSLLYCTTTNMPNGYWGVFEVKGWVNQCKNLPGSSNPTSTTFNNLRSSPSVTWTTHVFTVSPDCDFDTDPNSGGNPSTTVAFNWNPCKQVPC